MQNLSLHFMFNFNNTFCSGSILIEDKGLVIFSHHPSPAMYRSKEVNAARLGAVTSWGLAYGMYMNRLRGGEFWHEIRYAAKMTFEYEERRLEKGLKVYLSLEANLRKESPPAHSLTNLESLL